MAALPPASVSPFPLPAGVQAWKSKLDSKHAALISALNDYKATAAENNHVAKGSHFAHINSQCDEIVGKHTTAHHELHSQYIITYNPNNKDEGGWHDIKVTVSRSDSKVRARPGYWMATVNE